jgi:hypothetical protein
MAEMIPDRLPSGASAGEKKMFALLQQLPDDAIVYYEPVVAYRYPDFIVIIPSVGLLVTRTYLGPGTIGEPAAGFLGTGTVTFRCSPLLFMTLKETLPDADPAAMLLATACALSTFLPPASTMTSPATIPFSWAGLPAVTAVTSAPFVASGKLFCLRSSGVNVRIFNPIRGESCASTETATVNTSTTAERTLAIARTIKVLNSTFQSRITILHRRKMLGASFGLRAIG